MKAAPARKFGYSYHFYLEKKGVTVTGCKLRPEKLKQESKQGIFNQLVIIHEDNIPRKAEGCGRFQIKPGYIPKIHVVAQTRHQARWGDSVAEEQLCGFLQAQRKVF